MIVFFCIGIAFICLFAIMKPEDTCYDRNLFKCGQCPHRGCKYHKMAALIEKLEKENNKRGK